MLPADLFTHEAQSRPLFEEPSDASYREDPWTGPQGFMIGGMSLPTKSELADQYFDAAYLLLKSIADLQWEDYKLVNPALYLFRHAVELQAKVLVRKAETTHSLTQLADRLAAQSSNGASRIPDWVIARLKEIARIDPGSTAFRYAENFDKATKAYVRVDGEVYVSVPHVRRAMLALFSFLRGGITDIARQFPPEALE